MQSSGKVTLYVGGVEIVKEGGNTTYRRYVGGVLLQTVTGSTVTSRYLFHDQLGSVVRVADATAQLQRSAGVGHAIGEYTTGIYRPRDAGQRRADPHERASIRRGGGAFSAGGPGDRGAGWDAGVECLQLPDEQPAQRDRPDGDVQFEEGAGDRDRDCGGSVPAVLHRPRSICGGIRGGGGGRFRQRLRDVGHDPWRRHGSIRCGTDVWRGTAFARLGLGWPGAGTVTQRRHRGSGAGRKVRAWLRGGGFGDAGDATGQSSLCHRAGSRWCAYRRNHLGVDRWQVCQWGDEWDYSWGDDGAAYVAEICEYGVDVRGVEPLSDVEARAVMLKGVAIFRKMRADGVMDGMDLYAEMDAVRSKYPRAFVLDCDGVRTFVAGGGEVVASVDIFDYTGITIHRVDSLDDVMRTIFHEVAHLNPGLAAIWR